MSKRKQILEKLVSVFIIIETQLSELQALETKVVSLDKEDEEWVIKRLGKKLKSDPKLLKIFRNVKAVTNEKTKN